MSSRFDKIKAHRRRNKLIPSFLRKKKKNNNKKKAIIGGAVTLAALGFAIKKGIKKPPTALKTPIVQTPVPKKNPIQNPKNVTYEVVKDSSIIKPIGISALPKKNINEIPLSLETKTLIKGRKIQNKEGVVSNAKGYKGLSKTEKSAKVRKRQSSIQRQLDLDTRKASRFGDEPVVRKSRTFGLKSRSKSLDGFEGNTYTPEYSRGKLSQKNRLLSSKRKKAAEAAKKKYRNYSRY